MSNIIEKTEKAIGIYYLLGYGQGVGNSHFYCVPFLERYKAEEAQAQAQKMSGTYSYVIVSDMAVVADYCYSFLREIPFARRTIKVEADE